MKLLVCCLVLAGSVTVAAQWGNVPEAKVPRDEKGAIRYDAPTPRTIDGRNKPDFSGMWMRARRLCSTPKRKVGNPYASGAWALPAMTSTQMAIRNMS